jgi:hypothetical protein
MCSPYSYFISRDLRAIAVPGLHHHTQIAARLGLNVADLLNYEVKLGDKVLNLDVSSEKADWRTAAHERAAQEHLDEVMGSPVKYLDWAQVNWLVTPKAEDRLHIVAPLTDAGLLLAVHGGDAEEIVARATADNAHARMASRVREAQQIRNPTARGLAIQAIMRDVQSAGVGIVDARADRRALAESITFDRFAEVFTDTRFRRPAWQN